MNGFTTISAQIDRIFSHVGENAEGKSIENVGLEVHHGANTDVIFTPIALFERRFGFRISAIAKQALIGGMVIYERSVVREGEEFTYFPGAEEVHTAEADITINNVKSVVINPMFATVLGMLEPASTEVQVRGKAKQPAPEFKPEDFEQFNDEPKEDAEPKSEPVVKAAGKKEEAVVK